MPRFNIIALATLLTLELINQDSCLATYPKEEKESGHEHDKFQRNIPSIPLGCLDQSQSTESVPHKKFIKGRFYNSSSEWKDQKDTWKVVSFNKFRGSQALIGITQEENEVSTGSYDQIIIPEDGVYSLSAHSHWKGFGGWDSYKDFYTGIAINDPVTDYFVQHFVECNLEQQDTINHVTRLERGSKVMMSIRGCASYDLKGFWFEIEKLHD